MSNASTTKETSILDKIPLAVLRAAEIALLRTKREPDLRICGSVGGVDPGQAGSSRAPTKVDPDQVEFLASGGYNNIWLISLRADQKLREPIAGASLSPNGIGCPQKFILRTPKEESLLPDQVRNEVAFLTYVKQHLPSVPVPAVYAFDTGKSNPDLGTTESDTGPSKSSGIPFIAMEFIDGDQLDRLWKTLTEEQKLSACRQIVDITFSLAERSFPVIGGMIVDQITVPTVEDPSAGIDSLTLNHSPGPTVEGTKLFKGRNRFHSHSYYNIGPYKSTKEYALSYYDKEIYYYRHARNDDIDWDLFETTSKDDFVHLLEKKRQELIESDSLLPEQPFVLSHGDLNARNIIMRDGKVAALLDWEFAGTYPLSEFFGGTGIDVTILEDDQSEEENARWNCKIFQLVEEEGRRRGWEEEKIALLLGDGDEELQEATTEMFPRD